MSARLSPHWPTYEGKAFTIPILDINSVHTVYVPFVEDGPWLFFVRLKTMEESLEKLMDEINEYSLVPLRSLLISGSVCLGRFSDQTLRRAIVTSVNTDECELYSVDFGVSETRPYSDIYELSPKYINPQVMALRFTLSGLKHLPESDEMKASFKKLVEGKCLTLKVLTPEGPPGTQYCELSHRGQNVLQILLRPLEYKPLLLSIGAKDMVVVPYIADPSHFYIQLARHAPALNMVMMAVETHCANSPPLPLQSLKLGLACCALYAEDNKWYRAKVITIFPESVYVKFVDYGNVGTVSLSSLRKIESHLVSVAHMQAVKCCLSGFEKTRNSFLATKFDDLIGKETLKFTVVGKVEDRYIVNLYNTSSGSEVDIGRILLEIKASMEQPATQPVQHENTYEPPAPVAELHESQEAAKLQETSQEIASTFNKNYQSSAANKETFNGESSPDDKEREESHRSQNSIRKNSPLFKKPPQRVYDKYTY